MENLNDTTPEGVDAGGIDYGAVLAAGDPRDVMGDLAPASVADRLAKNPATLAKVLADPEMARLAGAPVGGADTDDDAAFAAALAGWDSSWGDDAAAAEAPEPEPADPGPEPDDGPTHAAGGTAFKRPPPPRPTIKIETGRLDIVATQVEAALVDSGEPIYRRDRELVRPCVREVSASHGRTTLAAGLIALNSHSMFDAMCKAAMFQRFDARKEEWHVTNPPQKAADILLSRPGQWHFRSIAGVITTPTLRPNGSVLELSGYDPATRLYHHADPNIRLRPCVAHPTRKDAERALRTLCELLREFPFVGVKAEGGRLERTVSGAVALSAILTAVVRGAMSVAPLHVLNAHTAGTGKSYLADIVSAIATGQPCPAMNFPPHDPVENEKKLVGELLAGTTLVSLDNVNGELGSDLLAQATERPILRLRRLGATGNFEVENRVTLLATGNNLQVRSDMNRRTLVCDMDAEMERPETRDFKGKPVGTILADRSKYISAALVVVRSHILAGSPGKLSPLASFEEWTALVPSALTWLGCANPLDGVERARADDPEREELREVIAAWNEAFGSSPLTLSAAVTEAEQLVSLPDADGEAAPYGTDRAPRYPALADALKRVSGGRVAVDTGRLGKWLRSRKGKIVNGLRFNIDGTTGGSARWKVERT